MKEKTPAANGSNDIRIKGPVYSCVVKDTGNGAVSAMLEICTAVRDNNSWDRKYKNHQYHRIRITAKGEKAERLKEIEKKCLKLIELTRNGDKESIETMDLLDVVEVNGILRNSKDGSFLFVDVKEDGFSVAKKLRMNNTAEMRGEVIETSCNKAWARMLLNIPAAEGENAIVPICIAAKDNPEKYKELSDNRLEKGSIIRIKGPLTSGTYADGNSQMFVCSVKIKNYEVLSRKKEAKTETKTQKNRTQLGM